MTTDVTKELLDHYGKPIAALLADPEVTEVCVNRWDEVWVERRGRLRRENGVAWGDEQALVAMIKQVAHSLGQEVASDGNPILDARLPDGTRINATLPPVAVFGPTMSIRPYPKRVFTAQDLLDLEAITPEVLDVLVGAVAGRLNLVISGGTGSGKTTVLRALCQYVDPAERVLTVEDTAENLLPAHPHLLSFEAAKRPNAKGPQVTMGRLIENALRQRPDRLVVGEIRTPEAATAYLDGLNTGHDGILTTIHANHEVDALARIDVLYAREARNIDMAVVERLVRANIHLVAHVARERHGEEVTRRVKGVAWLAEGRVTRLIGHSRAGGYLLDRDSIERYRTSLPI
jgi:pilus assembly protein CpaF